MILLQAQAQNILEYDDYKQIQCIGNPEILHNTKLALFCSVKTPGDIILKTFDYARYLRQQDITVISGFHSPMEQECLRHISIGRV